MTPDTRLLLYALGAVVALVVLIARFKLHPFLVLIAVSLAMGIASGMPPAAAVTIRAPGWASPDPEPPARPSHTRTTPRTRPSESQLA